MELENIKALKASEADRGGEGQRLEPEAEAEAEAGTWASLEDDVAQEPEAEQASEASPGSEAAAEPQEPRTSMT